MRNKQYGQKTLSLLAKQGKTLILEIDPPKDGISKRRKGFMKDVVLQRTFSLIFILHIIK